MDGEATITSKGQVTIPKGVRDDLALKPGDRISFVRTRRGEYSVRKRLAGSPFKRWRGALKDLTGKDVDRLIDEMRGR